MSSHIERIRDALEAAGIEVDEIRLLPTGLGEQLRCAGGAVVVVYNTGKVVAQGKGVEAVKAALAGIEGPAKVSKPVAHVVSAPSFPLEGQTQPATEEGPLKLWTDEPWDGVTMPWDPIR